MMHKEIAIIGGNGFIGKNMSQFFSALGYQVTVLDRSVSKFPPTASNIKFFAVDIHHTAELLDKLDTADYVIWLVHASVPSTQDDTLVDDFILNIAPLVKFLEKAKTLTNLKKFIYFSSGGTIYGNVENNIPVKEDEKQNPISNYGLSKSVAENYVKYLSRNTSFESIVLRPSNVYGQLQNLVKPQGIIGYAFKSVKNNEPLTLYDGGKVIRDFVYVNDVASAVEKCLHFCGKPGETVFYNVGSSEAYSIAQILEKIEIISGSKLQIIHKSSRNFDCDYNVLDNSKLSESTGWKKNTKLEDGLEEVWKWIQNEYNI